MSVYQALIVADQYDPVDVIDDLLRELEAEGISVFVSNTVKDISNVLPQLQADKPFLYYKNCQTRIRNPRLLLEWHWSNIGFHNVRLRGEYVTFIPNRSVVFRDELINSCVLVGTEAFVFDISQFDVVDLFYRKPNVRPPHIFVYSKDRPDYLKHSLDSLRYSLGEDTSVPITLFLNEPTLEMLGKVRSWNFEWMDIVCIEKNSFYSAINLAVQWANPETFVVFEDDFILPHTARDFFPNWPYLFADRLRNFDVVGWAPNTDNAPRIHRFPKLSDAYCFSDWVNGGPRFNNSCPLLLGNALATTQKYWRSCEIKAPWYLPLDSHLLRTANYSTPALRGYHIGWNQQMDGYSSAARPSDAPMQNTLRSIVTGRTETFRLDSILSQ